MEKRSPTDPQSHFEATVENNFMAEDSIIPLEEVGDTEMFSCLKSENDSGTGRSCTNSSKKIKPISKMAILNDAVRRITLPDGSPAP